MIKSNVKLSWMLVAALACSADSARLAHGQDQADSTTATGATNTLETAVMPAEESDAAPEASPTEGANPRTKKPRGANHDVICLIGQDVEIKAGETADTVVLIGGSAKVRGKVRGPAVIIWGNLEIDGEVRDAAFAFMGNIRVGQGARIRGETVAVGGKVDVAEGAVLDRRPESVDFPEGLKKWFTHCFLMMRPLAPQVGWVWVIAGVFGLIYLLVAVLFQRPVHACVNELCQRPTTTFLLGILSLVLLPLALLILTATGIGLVVLPFVLAALLFGAIIGKVALVEALGMQIGKQAHLEALQQPLTAFLVGLLVVTLLYLVPLLGVLAFGVISLWGVGVAVTATFGGLRREMPEKPGPQLRDRASAETRVAGAAASASMPTGNPADAGPQFSAASASAAPPVMLPDALAYPKAGFWERVGAAFLDIILVSILGALVGGAPWGFLVALAYFAGFWAWKGTTVGGVVLGLKVARMDGKPVTFPVALVRGLAAAFSLVVLLLGYLWIAWDKDKQGWHDKIAGTVVLKLPRGTPLVCF